MVAPPYVELHAHSAFSFLDGASTPIELANAATELGYAAFALTDHDGVWGSLEFAEACADLELRPIVGAELTVALPTPGADGAEAGPPADLRHMTLLVEDQIGYRNLCRLLTAAHAHTRDNTARTATPPWATLEQVERHAEGLVCLSGCARDGLLAGCWARGERGRAEGLARRLLGAFGRERFRVELQLPLWRHDRARNRWLVGLASRLGVAAVATGNVHSHSARRARLQDVLVAIGRGETLEESEPHRRGNRSSALVGPAAMAARFAEHPEAVGETVRLAERLRFDLTSQLGYRYPQATDADATLAELCRGRLDARYAGRGGRREAEQRLEVELATIRNLGLSGFFLLHHDLLELAREVAVEVRGRDSTRSLLPPGRGRGSSVSSIVCYLTGLSHIDPVTNNLFAGRFLNDEASSLPDIDLDFPRDIREVLIPRIHEVYGADRSALVAAFPTYRPRGVVRDLGKALGLPPAEIERVAAVTGFHDSAGELARDVVSALGTERAAAPRWRALLWLSEDALGLPRHASQHSGGMVISTEPLVDVCPVVPAAMAGRQIVQWDKDSCADAGLLKIDLLGLGMLSAVERCVAELEETRGEALDLSRIDYDDAGTFDSIRRAETTGVFQIESRAQMQMLPRTQPRTLEDLTVQVALVRPGPIQGGAVHPYIDRRKRLREEPGYEPPFEHDSLRKVLAETLGTIVYQEQVLEVAIEFAGFSSAEAESLRRAMSRKRSTQAIERHHRRFVEGACARHDVAPELAERIWDKIQGFSGFGFPKAHSAAFGLLSYQSAWLRFHRGPEFLCALLNEQPMGFYPPDALAHEAQRRGLRVAPPDVNRSRVLCHVESPRNNPSLRGGMVVRIGLGYVKGVREEEMRALVAARERVDSRGRGGYYCGVADLASRSGVGLPCLERLAWAGALDDLPAGSGGDRREALWRVGVVGTAGSGTQLGLPLEPPPPPSLPPLGEWDRLIADYRSTGMVLGKHPLELLRPRLPGSIHRAAALAAVADGTEVEVAGLVVARQRPETAKGIVFLLFEDESGVVNLIVGRAVYERFRALVRSAPLLVARGRLERRESVTNVLVAAVREPEHATPPPAPPRPQRPEPPPGADREPAARRRRQQAVAELRSAVPAGHSFGRRGR